MNGTVQLAEAVIVDDRPTQEAARGMGSMATIAPPRASTTTRIAGEQTDHQLVAAVRAGDDRAFECLYERYHRRIAAYIYGMVNDYARAEDIAQDVFMSALRRMRETERPIAFKPWIYEIAKNACIDQFRRTRRAEEVSYDAEDGLAAADYGRLVTTGPTPDVAVDQKMSLDHLCGAFGGLSETHHEILVMRELEGLSYREIGERLGMSRPSVESTLFRARRRLTEEYSELVSGERCRRIQAIIAAAATGSLGTRDQRRMARHVSYCQPCRRQARLAGLDSSVLAHTPVRAKIAAFLPLPAFLRRRWGGGSDGLTGVASGHAPTVAQWSSAVSDPSTAGWIKAAATAATIAIAGAGAGVAVQGDDAGIAKGLAGVDALRHSGSGSKASPSVVSPVHRRVASNVPGATAHNGRATRRNGSGRSKTTTSVTTVPSKTGGSQSGSTAQAPSTSTAPVTAPSIPGTSSDPSRPTSGGTTSTTLPTLDPSGTTTTGGSLPLPDVSGVTDTGTKTGDVVDQTVTTVTDALGGG
jgi:RNA polymerase sigma factor (sigma-70 family)